MLNIIVCIRFSGLSHESASPVNTTIKNIYIYKFDLKYEKHMLNNITKNYGSEPVCYLYAGAQKRNYSELSRLFVDLMDAACGDVHFHYAIGSLKKEQMLVHGFIKSPEANWKLKRNQETFLFQNL